MKKHTFRARLALGALLLAGIPTSLSASARALPADASGGTLYQELKSFGRAGTGGAPLGSLLLATDGAYYGTLRDGGSAYAGRIFRILADGSGFTAIADFDYSTTGGYPGAGLIQGTDGALYGTTTSGGSGYGGTVFRVNTDGSGFEVLQNFDYSSTGYDLESELLQAADGVLYGATTSGGSWGGGTLFRLHTDGSGFELLIEFDYFSTGVRPCRLMQGADGALYGTASDGGSGYAGTVFRVNTDGSGFVLIQNFDEYTTGRWPSAGLLQGSDGALYGTTSFGGTGYGTVFKLNTDGSDFSALQAFDYASTGAYPDCELIQGTDGLLYGTTTDAGLGGNGTVFKLGTDGSGFVVLRDLQSATTGGSSHSGLVQAASGDLLGSASSGGGAGGGTLFRLNQDGSGFAVLEELSVGADVSEDGGYLYAGLLQAADGYLYGVTYAGGSNGYGTVFKMHMDGTGFGLLKEFDYSTTGGYLEAALTLGTDGVLYGAASQGGSAGYGTVFKLNRNGSGFAVLKEFDLSTSGGYLHSRLIQGLDGALYGTAGGGGTNGFGTVFKLNRNGTGFTVLQNFNHDTTGAAPIAGLIQGSNGALYGTTFFGGSFDAGTLFRLNPNGTGFTILKNFDSTSGGFPQTALKLGADGKLYGVANSGGSFGYGTLFKVRTNGDSFSVLLNFDSTTTGAYPSGSLIQGADGALYGTTGQGGTGGAGTVFKLKPNGTEFGVLQNFDTSTTGTGPACALLQATDGFLYGTTTAGGPGSAGCVFRLIPFAPEPTIGVLWPPNHNLVTVGISGVGGSCDGNTIVITSVTQDEPTSGLGIGDKPVDAFVQSNGTVRLRAERSNTANGRVYHVHFTAYGADGFVTVQVPLVQSGQALDEGELYDSTH